MVEQQKFSFLAIGRPEPAGCYCKVNAYLKEIITLLAGDFDYVVIDAMGEVGRRMPVEFRETALGGLAATPTGRRVKQQMHPEREA